MKKIFLILLLVYSSAAAQSEQKSIELPDFVITGRQSVELPAAQKKKPDLIGTITKDFLLPEYSPEELPLLISSLPVPVKPKIFSDEYFNGFFNAGLGIQTIPIGNLHLSKSFGNYVVSAGLWGQNIKNYLPYSDFNNSGVTLNNNLFVSTKSDFMPGTKINLGGEYSQSTYNFYASAVPSTQRRIQNGKGYFDLTNNYNRWLDFNAGIELHLFSEKQSTLKERDVEINSAVNFKLNGFVIGGAGTYQKQILENNLSGKGDYYFYSVEGFAKSILLNSVEIKGGILYANNNRTDMLSPFASASLKLKNGFVLTAGLEPSAQNITVKDMFAKNIYVQPMFTDNVFIRTKSNFFAALNYEHFKMFSVGIKAGLSSSDEYLYFEDNFVPGHFFALTANDVENFYSEINFVAHPSVYGYLKSNLKFSSVKNSSGNFIPYEPKFKADFIYGFDFDFGLGVEAGLNYVREIYTDLANTNAIDDYTDLFVGLKYKLWDALSITADFQNILNKSNFVLKGYEQKPFDVIIAAEYRW